MIKAAKKLSKNRNKKEGKRQKVEGGKDDE